MWPCCYVNAFARAVLPPLYYHNNMASIPAAVANPFDFNYGFDSGKRYWHFYFEIDDEHEVPHETRLHKILYLLVDLTGVNRTSEHTFYVDMPLRALFPAHQVFHMIWGSSEEYYYNPLGYIFVPHEKLWA
jgi:hypothetical protein